MKRVRLVTFFMLPFLVGLILTGVEARPLSLDEALDLARENNHQIQIALSQLEQAKGQKMESWSGFLPNVTISETFMRSNDPVAVFGMKLRQGIFTEMDFSIPALNDPDDIENYNTSFAVQQPLLNVDAIFGRAAASAGVKAREFGLQRTEEAIALYVEKAYFGLILARNHLTAIEQAIKAVEAHNREAQAAFDKGLVTEADLLAANVRLAELQEQKIMAANQIEAANDGLTLLLALPETTTIEPTDSLTVAPDLPDVPNPQNLSEQRADLLAMRYQEKAYKHQLNMERGGWLPRLNAFGMYDWHAADPFKDDGTNWTVGVALQWNVLDGLGRFGRVKTAAARRQEVRHQLKQAEAKSRTEVTQAYRALEAARQRIDVAETAVAQADESLRIVRARFQEGLERSSELLTRETALTQARLRLLNATYDYKVAQSELQFYLGSNE